MENIDKNKFLIEAEARRQQMLQGGSVDSEAYEIGEIISQVISGKEEITEAGKKIQRIEEQRQDYH